MPLPDNPKLPGWFAGGSTAPGAPSGLSPELQQRFASRLPQRVSDVTDAVEHACEANDAPSWEAARRAAHQLAGTAGSYGYVDISRALNELQAAIARGAARGELRGIIHALRARGTGTASEQDEE